METKTKFTPNPDLKLMDQVRQVLRYHHYAFNTEKAYCKWILRYIRYFGIQRHPRTLGAKEVETFLSHLATSQKVSAATQRQALNAVIFLYKQVLHIDINDKIAPIRAKRLPRLPVVMSVDETRAVLNRMQGPHLFMSELLYGAGLRLMECVRLRVNSIDFERGMIYVRFGKGGKDRGVPLPKTLAEKLNTQLETVRRIHTADLAEGFGEAWLPEGFARKMGPGARDLGWQYLFPAKKRIVDPRSGRERRHHVLASGLQKAVRVAALRTGLTKRIASHTFRHSYPGYCMKSFS